VVCTADVEDHGAVAFDLFEDQHIVHTTAFVERLRSCVVKSFVLRTAAMERSFDFCVVYHWL